MRYRNKLYWVINITRGFDIVFQKRLAGSLSNKEIATILQRLASRDLSPREVISASIRKPERTSLLDVRVDGPPHCKRTLIWLPAFPDYKASHWHEDELATHPEIMSEV